MRPFAEAGENILEIIRRLGQSSYEAGQKRAEQEFDDYIYKMAEEHREENDPDVIRRKIEENKRNFSPKF